MSERASHKFQFNANIIAEAAEAEAAYHDERVVYWEDRLRVALATVKATIGAKVVESEVTGGKRADVIVDYGDPEAWREYQLAYGKVRTHKEAADRYLTDARLYGTQSVQTYELDSDDVHHFRLGGQERED
jgi:hypothetical protein